MSVSAGERFERHHYDKPCYPPSLSSPGFARRRDRCKTQQTGCTRGSSTLEQQPASTNPLPSGLCDSQGNGLSVGCTNSTLCAEDQELLSSQFGWIPSH